MSKNRILFVDDDDDFRIPVARLLRREGFEVRERASARHLATDIATDMPDLLLMDIMMPEVNGLDAMRNLDPKRPFPAILLSARSDVEQRVEGIQTGADYYLCKPVSGQELVAVMNNLLARYTGKSPAQPAEWIFDAVKWYLQAPTGQKIQLTTTEYRVMDQLLTNQGQAVQRKTLLTAMGKPNASPDDQSLSVLISRLRTKFEDHDIVLPVKSVRGTGYMFTDAIRTIGLVLPETRTGQKDRSSVGF